MCQRLHRQIVTYISAMVSVFADFIHGCFSKVTYVVTIEDVLYILRGNEFPHNTMCFVKQLGLVIICVVLSLFMLMEKSKLNDHSAVSNIPPDR